MFPFAKSLQKKKELPITELMATIGEIRLFHKSSYIIIPLFKRKDRTKFQH